MSNELEQNPAPEEKRDEAITESAEPAKPAISPGQELSKRREELNLTVEQVAAHLNLAPRQVKAIEADNFDALPGMAIARGFVRSYAKVVGLEAEPLLASMAPAIPPIPQAAPVKKTYVSKPLGGKDLSFDGSGRRKSMWIWVAVALAVLIAVIVAVRQSDGISWSGPDDETATQPQGDQPASPDGRAVEVLPQPDIALPPASESEAPADTPAPQAPDAAPAAPTKVPAPAAESSGETVSSHPLVIKARQESWIELKRTDGTVMVSRVIEGGTEASFPLKGEFLLTIGNASGVDAMLRGKPLDVQGSARGNVARINLK